MLRKIRIILAAIVFILCAALFLDGSGTVSSWFGWIAKIQFLPALLALNLLPVAALTALFWLLFNRAWAAVAGSGILVLGMSLVNYYKIVLRNDPFLAADVFLVSEAANMTGAYTLRIPLSVVLAVAGTAAAVSVSRARRAARIVFFIICGAGLGIDGARGSGRTPPAAGGGGYRNFSPNFTRASLTICLMSCSWSLGQTRSTSPASAMMKSLSESTTTSLSPLTAKMLPVEL